MDALVGWPGGDVQSSLKLLGTLVALYLGAIWLASVYWAYRDVRTRSADPILQGVGVAVVALLPLIGIPIYLVLRPSETTQQAYERELEQDALLAELQQVAACPGCRRPVRDEFLTCPYCRATLKDACGRCGRPLTHGWAYCPFCAAARQPARSAQRSPSRAAVEGERERPAESAPRRASSPPVEGNEGDEAPTIVSRRPRPSGGE